MVDLIITPEPAPLRIRAQPADPANYSRARREPRLIVLHSTEGREGDGATDANVAAGIARPKPAGQRTSFHYVVDADSATRCVPDTLTAWHCGKTGNQLGIGIELCGSAKQTRDQWLDDASRRTLGIAARLVADLCREHRIPLRYLSAFDLNHLSPWGITTHAAISEAWRESTHWDPGPDFPIDLFMAAVNAARSP
jgi:N-acetyl-anhydromuramyl-L-alanine amidase AmpD